MFKLVIQDDEGKTTVVPLIRDEITIGRKEGNTIRLTERNVSRRHARILRNNGEVQIEDLGSYNGIRVNNARIAERVSLRVSDQVQIGDYKLYLKAEGVEQIDDAQTRPVERVETASTDLMTAAVPPPTQQMQAATTTPAPGTLVGNPNFTQVQLPDADPQGRPVASQAAIEKLIAPAGYGKLVVLSSNFAGKEFDLSRPQMIVGRTEENDIVVNHRSISRNHAKLVREPDSGRYTISDLQSSNGVRVNGQDYGKVELRRGDVIDLGHVRLRFVEPGEDFVFSRDAVITDVPDAGGRRGMMIMIVLGVLVLAGVVAFVLLRSKDKPDGGNTGTGPGTGGANNVIADAPEIATGTPDAAEGPGPTPVLDAPGGQQTAASGELEVECLRYQTDQKWGDLDLCADRLKATNATLAKDLKTRATLETKAQPKINAFEQAMRDKDLKRASAELEALKSVTSYGKLKQRYEQAEDGAIRDMVGRLERVNDGDCKKYNQIVQQEKQSKPPRVATEAMRQVKCTPSSGTTTTQVTPPSACNHEELADKGGQQYSLGNLAAALAAYEAAWACKAESEYALKSFVISCNLPNLAKARLYWRRMAPAKKPQAVGICVRNGLSEEQLNAP